MKFQVLLSTMNNGASEINNLVKKMNIKSHCLIINQNVKWNINKKQHLKSNIEVLNCYGKGLSKSRNLAINNATADICLLSDDDLEYVDDLEELIIKSFDENLDADILVYKVIGKNKKFKDYSNKKKNLGYLGSMKISSVQIAFRRKSILENNLYFNELLGAGAKYSMGEENEFLFKCLKSGLKVRFIPIKIADLYIGESTWFSGYNRKYFLHRGASFYSMSDKFYFILILQFAIRKKKLYIKEFSTLEVIKLMYLGKRLYEEEFKKTNIKCNKETNKNKY